MNYLDRMTKLRKNLSDSEKFPYLISDLVNIKYLTGFNGSYAYIIIGKKYTCFITDSRYEEIATSLLDSKTDLVLQKTDLFNTVKEYLPKHEKILFIEEHSAPLSFFMSLKKTLKGVKVIPAGDDVNSLRMVKDKEEIILLNKAANIVDECFLHILKFIKTGITEWDISNEIEFFFRKNGCRKSSFPSIVASGAGSSMPHYETSMKKKIKYGDTILIDMGCEFSGYNSDLTRTLFMGKIDKNIEKIYAVVRNAQETALAKIKPGMLSGDADALARDVIAQEGYGEFFGHSLGHGVGLEIHELPALKKGGGIKIPVNSVLTVEPGIYLPGKGGVRIEDTCLITEKGCEALTRSPKDFIII